MEWITGSKWCSAFVSVVVAFTGASYVSAAVVIPWVTVGNPGNRANSNGFGPGSVGYNYLIGKYDVTNNQYAEFLNTVDQTGSNTKSLYDSRMSNYPGHVDWTGGINFNSGATVGSKYSVKGGQGNLPLVWVSFNSAARFANWLNNGQGAASTESGAYDMTQALPSRTANANVFIPNENEWYKAAYYDPTKDGTGGYWIYAARSDNIPTSQPPPGGSNSANFVEAPSGRYALSGSASRNESLIYLTDVGAYSSSSSYYGTFDQNGDVSQWTESLSLSSHIIRGGAWDDTAFPMASNVSGARSDPYNDLGFRVAALPEPVSGCAVIILAGLVGVRRRPIR